MICPIKPSTFGRIAMQDWDITDITIKAMINHMILINQLLFHMDWQ